MDVENVLIFVSDTLRWDHLPDGVARRGVPFKTVAQGGKTVLSFPSLTTGLRPGQHGVSSWTQRLPASTRSIFDLESVETGFLNSGQAGDALNPVVGANRQAALSDLDPPFLHLERDNHVHAPHGGFESVEAYFRARCDNIHQLKREYERAVVDSQRVFERRLDELADRGILDETLVVFTSDHGELLGEYGELGHGSPLSPELSYVPTVFVHPDLSEADFRADPDDEVIEHVDIPATALGVLGEDSTGMVGTDLLEDERDHDFGHSYSSLTNYDRKLYRANSIWWHEGGYVFPENGRLTRLLFALGHAAKANRRHYLRRHIWYVLQHNWAASHVYGDPPVDEQRAKALLGELLTDQETDADQGDLDTDTKETLRDLGYHP